MGYPRENLHPSETLVLDLHPHWWFFTPSLAALIGTTVLGLVAFFSDWHGSIQLACAAAIVACLVWFGLRYTQWATTDLVLTSDRLIWRTGVIAKDGIEIPLERINTIFSSQKIWERILGLGDLRVESASATGAQVFRTMKRPERIRNEIYVQTEEAEQNRQARYRGYASAESEEAATHAGEGPPAPPAPAGSAQAAGPAAPVAPAAPAAPPESIPDQIARLAELRDAGIISDAEFQEKKTDLLGRM